MRKWRPTTCTCKNIFKLTFQNHNLLQEADFVQKNCAFLSIFKNFFNAHEWTFLNNCMKKANLLFENWGYQRRNFSSFWKYFNFTFQNHNLSQIFETKEISTKFLQNSKKKNFFLKFLRIFCNSSSLRVLWMCESAGKLILEASATLRKSIFHHFHAFRNAETVLEMDTATTGNQKSHFSAQPKNLSQISWKFLQFAVCLEDFSKASRKFHKKEIFCNNYRQHCSKWRKNAKFSRKFQKTNFF